MNTAQNSSSNTADLFLLLIKEGERHLQGKMEINEQEERVESVIVTHTILRRALIVMAASEKIPARYIHRCLGPPSSPWDIVSISSLLFVPSNGEGEAIDREQYLKRIELFFQAAAILFLYFKDDESSKQEKEEEDALYGISFFAREAEKLLICFPDQDIDELQALLGLLDQEHTSASYPAS